MYKVRNLKGDTWQVYLDLPESIKDGSLYYQGSLSDCEAWIRLAEQGRLG